jgi:hypothetical protein
MLLIREYLEAPTSESVVVVEEEDEITVSTVAEDESVKSTISTQSAWVQEDALSDLEEPVFDSMAAKDGLLQRRGG